MVGPPTKDAFDFYCLRVDYQTKHWLNANNAQMDVRTATDTCGWKLGGDSVVDSLFNVAPIVCWGSVLCPSFFLNMHYLLSFLVLLSSSRGRERELVAYFNCFPDVL